MLIRRRARDVFRAFVDPDITTKFWFTKSSGKLVPGGKVQWEWEMYGVSVPVSVIEVDPDRRIVIQWAGKNGATTVEWEFTERSDGTTFVSITNHGFTGDGDDLCSQVADSTQGFTLVLAGLKALLEHNICLNLVPDRYPKDAG
jgi:uncharacterized protein YndB with AHSA1/START domain